MKFKKLFIVSILLIALISISASFASDVSADSIVDDDSANIEINENIQNDYDAKIVSLFRTNDTDLRDFDSDSSSNFNSDSNINSNLETDSNSDSDSETDSDSNLNSPIQYSSDSSSNSKLSSDKIITPDLNTSFTDLGINFTDSNTIFVNASYTGSTESGTMANPYKTVNTAFSKLINGYSSSKRNLFIADGLYELSNYLSITRSVNIIGESALNTILSIKTSNELLYVKSNDLYVNIFNLTLSKGSSDSGGALYSNRSYVNLVNTIFKENSAVETASYYSTYYAYGGAVFNDGGDMRIYNCSFINNKATGDEDSYGGAIYNYMGSLSVYNSEFINNTIDATFGSGAAIYGYSGFLNVINSSFINNTIKSNYSMGGAIAIWQGHNTYVINSTIEGNVLNGDYSFGLAIAHQGALLDVENNTIKNNSALGISLDEESIYNMNGNFIASGNLEENNFYKSIDAGELLLCLEDQMTITKINDGSIELPSSYDLRDEGLVSPVSDQGSTGSCWAFATLAALESYLMKTEGVSYDFSEQNVRNVMGYYGTNGTDWDDGGNHIMSLAYLLRWSGPINETDDPFNSYSSRSSYTLDRVKHVQDVVYVPMRLGYLDNDEIKFAIMKYGALYTTIYSDSYFQYHTSYYSDWPEYSNHAITLVGWDDNYPASKFGSVSPPGDGAFIIKNSWGTSYGESGYWYISYYDKTFAGLGIDTISAMAFTNVENVTNYKDIYQYDILGNTFESVGYNSNTAWFANQFTATSDNPLSAFGFYSFGDSTVYSEVLVNGELKHSQSNEVKGTGYHTIKLDELIALKLGDIFRINIKITSPDSKFPVAIESQRSGYSSKASASLGQSYISPDGETWYDISKNTNVIKLYEYLIGNHTLYKTNVCLKAYTAYAGNLVLNITSNASLFFKGDLIEVTYNLTNVGDFIEGINVSLFLDESIYPDDLILVSKGSFDMYDNVWTLDSLDAGESAVLKISIYMSEKLDEIENFALVQSSGFNVGDSNYQSFKFYYSGLTKFLDIGLVSTLSKSGDEVLITLLDALNRPIADKDINIRLEGGEILSLTTNKNGTVSFELNLAEGNYTYLVLFEGDEEFEASRASFDVEVRRRLTHFVDEYDGLISIFSVSNEEIQIALLDNLNNPIADSAVSIHYKDLDRYIDLQTDSNGIARFNLNLTQGAYDIEFIFSGDELYAPCDIEVDVNVSKRKAPVILVGDDLLGLTDEFTVCLVNRDFMVLKDKLLRISFRDAYGKTTVYDVRTDENGVARLSNLTVGNYIVSGELTDDDEYYDSYFNPVILSITGISTKIEVDNIDKYYNNGTRLSARVSYENGESIANKPVKVIVYGDRLKGIRFVYNLISDENGYVSLRFVDLKEGEYFGMVVFDPYENIGSSSKSFNISIHNPVIKLETDSIKAGGLLSFTAYDYENNPLSNVSLVSIINETRYTGITDDSGRANIQTSLEAGDYDINTSFADKSKFGFYSQIDNINVESLATSIGAANLIKYYLNSSKLSISLKDELNNPLANRDLNVTLANKIYTVTTDSKGIASMDITLAAGNYSATISYAGDGSYLASSKKISVKVIKPIIKANQTSISKNSNFAVSFKTSDNKAIKNTKVTLTVDGKTYTKTTDSNGFVYLKFSQVGNFTVVCKFASSLLYGDSSLTAKVKVN